MNLRIKQKLNTAVNHVKSHPVPYAVGFALVASTAARYMYDTRKGMVSMTDVTKTMTDTGKGMYFRNRKTGMIVIAALYNPETMKDLKLLN